MRVVITENCCIDTSRTLYSTNVWSSVCVAASAVLYVMLLLCYGSGLLVVAGALLLQRHVVPRALLGQGPAILLYVCIFEHVYTILG